MNKERFEQVFIKQYDGPYFTSKQLEYSGRVGLHLSPFEYKEYLDYVDSLIDNNDTRIYRLPLKVFNSKHLYLVFSDGLIELINSCDDLLDDDYFMNNNYLSKRYESFLTKSRIYSEIEGTLNVENVPTTRKRLKELLEDNASIETTNDKIIKNMAKAIEYVESSIEFNKENLLHLYNILSEGCLDEENKLRDGDYYRYDSVEIDRYHGCPSGLIDESMNSLFQYVNDTLKKTDELWPAILLPHICHYYILYIHPYFDYNGRTARMVSYWVYILSKSNKFPPIISEAINQTRSEYYRALERSRDSHNDLTYFLKYIYELTIDYILCYMNLELASKAAKNKGIDLTDTELSYLKRILICYSGAFNYSDFLKMADVEMSKQGALKILNRFIDCGALKEITTKSKSKIFDINRDVVTYYMENFGYN